MTKLQSACLCSVTFLLLCRATSGKPIFVKSERSSSISGAVYSTNSKPSVPIGFSSPKGPFSATCVAMSVSFAAQLRLEQTHFKASWLDVSCAMWVRRPNGGCTSRLDAGNGRKGLAPDDQVHRLQRGLRLLVPGCPPCGEG